MDGGGSFSSRWLLGVALVAGAALRIHLALTDDGIYWPDEIYQSFEPAHRLVFGYGLIPWEFIEGARSWALPGLVACLLKLSALVGFDHPREYISFVKVVFALGSTATAYGSYLLARAYGAEPLFAATGATVLALAAPAVYFGPRALSENASALPIVLGLALAERPGRWRLLVGASLLGVSVLLRLHSGVFCLGLVLILLARRRWRDAGLALAALAAWAFLFGLLDQLTWHDAPGALFGGWFHSAVTYLQFHLRGRTAGGGKLVPWHFYLSGLFTSAPGVSVAVAALALASYRRAPGLLLLALAFFALHSGVAHGGKELRYMLPVLPLFAALAAIGLSTLPKAARWLVAPAVFSAAVWSGGHYHRLTMGDLGAYTAHPRTWAYDFQGPVNRMLLAAHDRPDVCGVRIDTADLAWSGGSTYLHRRVPLYDLSGPPVESRLFNYVVAFDLPNLPGTIVASDARMPRVVLVRLPFDGCAQDVGYAWRLP